MSIVNFVDIYLSPFGGAKSSWWEENGFSRCTGNVDVLALTKVKEMAEKLEDENTKLRGLLSTSNLPCLYCGLPSEDLAKCPHGFPGCGRADDMVLAGHVGEPNAEELSSTSQVVSGSGAPESLSENGADF